MMPVLPRFRFCAAKLGRYPSRLTASCMRAGVAGGKRLGLGSARLTVATDRPRSRATSFTVAGRWRTEGWDFSLMRYHTDAGAPEQKLLILLRCGMPAGLRL